MQQCLERRRVSKKIIVVIVDIMRLLKFSAVSLLLIENGECVRVSFQCFMQNLSTAICLSVVFPLVQPTISPKNQIFVDAPNSFSNPVEWGKSSSSSADIEIATPVEKENKTLKSQLYTAVAGCNLFAVEPGKEKKTHRIIVKREAKNTKKCYFRIQRKWSKRSRNKRKLFAAGIIKHLAGK